MAVPKLLLLASLLPHVFALPTTGASSSETDVRATTLCITTPVNNGDTIVACPGCLQIVSPNGDVPINNGPACPLSRTSLLETIARNAGAGDEEAEEYEEYEDEDEFFFTIPPEDTDVEVGSIDDEAYANSIERCGSVADPASSSYSTSSTLLDCLGCRTFEDSERVLHTQCPGCLRLEYPNGGSILRGPRCLAYERDLPRFGGASAAKVPDEEIQQHEQDGESDKLGFVQQQVQRLLQRRWIGGEKAESIKRSWEDNEEDDAYNSDDEGEEVLVGSRSMHGRRVACWARWKDGTVHVRVLTSNVPEDDDDDDWDDDWSTDSKSVQGSWEL